MVSAHPVGVVPVGLGDGVGDCHDFANFLENVLLPHLYLILEKTLLFFQGKVSFISVLLGMLVTEREPTLCFCDGYSVGTPNWAFREKGWQMHCKTMFLPFFGRFFLVSKRCFSFFGWVILWMFHIGRARHPGPGPRSFTLGQLSIEFVNVGGWLTYGDLALDSCAQFLAVAEHRFSGQVRLSPTP